MQMQIDPERPSLLVWALGDIAGEQTGYAGALSWTIFAQSLIACRQATRLTWAREKEKGGECVMRISLCDPSAGWEGLSQLGKESCAVIWCGGASEGLGYFILDHDMH